METFRDRLLIEHKDLLEKIVKLKSFVISDNINKIDLIQKVLLNVQLKAMETYSECLTHRINSL